MKPVVVKVAYRTGEGLGERALRTKALEHARSLGYRFTRSPVTLLDRHDDTLDPRFRLAVFTLYPVGHGPEVVRTYRVGIRVSIRVDAGSEEEAEEVALDVLGLDSDEADADVEVVSEVRAREVAS